MKRSRLVSSPLVWSLGLAASCAPPPPHVEPPPSIPKAPTAVPSVSAAPPPVEAGIDVAREIAERTVGGGRVAHKILYSWTTRAQLDELAAGSKLLTREISKTRGPAAFDDLVATEAALGVDVAELLFKEGYAKKRFAWPSPFATITGEDDGSYGEVLLRIELRDEAQILDYTSRQVFGVDGSHGALSDAIADPGRIAAVLFEGDGYREMVLVNESMIARWSAGAAPDVLHALAHEADFLLATADAIEAERQETPGLPSKTALALEGTLATNRKLTPTDLRSRARLLDGYRELARTAASGAPTTSFTLGTSRPPFPPACKHVRDESRVERRLVGSFATPRGSQRFFTPVCTPATPEVRCVPRGSLVEKESRCEPVPAFGQ